MEPTRQAILKARGSFAGVSRTRRGVDFQIEYLADHVDAIPALARSHHAQWRAVMPDLTVANRETHFRARAQRGSIPTGFVAVTDGRVVGLACLVDCDLDSHQHLSPWLSSVLVEVDYRGYGIGSALSEQATREAQVLSFTRVYLFTLDKQSFYRRLGSSKLQDAAFCGHSVTVMVRELDG
jgi:predicted N-acetyltransferase YhbS